MPVKPIPDGFQSITPHLIMRGAARAIEFYKQAFGAVELMRMPAPGDKLGHAEIKIGNSIIMLADEFPEMDVRGPASLGGTSVSILLYVENCDTTTNEAVAAGATILRPLQDQFYGDRSATVVDPFGHKWTIATHIEDVPPDEMERRSAAFMKQLSGTE